MADFMLVQCQGNAKADFRGDKSSLTGKAALSVQGSGAGISVSSVCSVVINKQLYNVRLTIQYPLKKRDFKSQVNQGYLNKYS